MHPKPKLNYFILPQSIAIPTFFFIAIAFSLFTLSNYSIVSIFFFGCLLYI